jgi:hypothetical protein
MGTMEKFQQGLLYVAYLLIHSDQEISDNELVYLHKMRVEEGMTDSEFAEHFKSIIGKSDREIYQIGIEALNTCPDEYKIRAFVRLYQMALADKVLRAREVRFILYAIKLANVDIDAVMNRLEQAA